MDNANMLSSEQSLNLNIPPLVLGATKYFVAAQMQSIQDVMRLKKDSWKTFDTRKLQAFLYIQ
jgi:hypothetical protein